MPVTIGDLVEWLGDEFCDELSPEQNVRELVAELKHFRKIAKTLEHFVVDVSNWLDDYEEGEYLDPSTNKPPAVVGASEESSS
jgi:hypothetical protein